MSAAEREQVRRQVVASRRRQGLPTHVDAVDVLDPLAADVLNQENDPAVDHGAVPPSAAKAERQSHHATVG